MQSISEPHISNGDFPKLIQMMLTEYTIDPKKTVFFLPTRSARAPVGTWRKIVPRSTIDSMKYISARVICPIC
jgi:hypothetical protein